MNTLLKTRLTETRALVDIMKDQDGSVFRVLTLGGAYFDITLTPGRHTYGQLYGMKCYIRQTCQVKHGITPLTSDGTAPTMYFNTRHLAILFRWEDSLPDSIRTQYLNEVNLLPCR